MESTVIFKMAYYVRSLCDLFEMWPVLKCTVLYSKLPGICGVSLGNLYVSPTWPWLQVDGGTLSKEEEWDLEGTSSSSSKVDAPAASLCLAQTLLYFGTK